MSHICHLRKADRWPAAWQQHICPLLLLLWFSCYILHQEVTDPQNLLMQGQSIDVVAVRTLQLGAEFCTLSAMAILHKDNITCIFIYVCLSYKLDIYIE